MSLDDLPTPEQMYAERKGKPISKGKTRLADVVDERKLTKVTDADFKKDVWQRDHAHCRCCQRKVHRVPGRVPERGEVHHCHGRAGDFRFLVKAALLLCLTCHERVTGKVNDKLIIMPSKTFERDGQRYIDATYDVKFRRA